MQNGGHDMRKPYFASLTVTLLILLTFVPMFLFTYTKVAAAGSGVGNIPQGTQTDTAYANSFADNHVTNVFATTQRITRSPISGSILLTPGT